jgi:hypothetical protein
MSSNDVTNRQGRQEPAARDSPRGWKPGRRDRDSALHGTPGQSTRGRAQEPSSQGGSTRARASENAARDSNPPTPVGVDDAEGYDDGSRKRPFSDRVRNEKDQGEPAADSEQPSKRRRTFIKDRERYKS